MDRPVRGTDENLKDKGYFVSLYKNKCPSHDPCYENLHLERLINYPYFLYSK